MRYKSALIFFLLLPLQSRAGWSDFDRFYAVLKESGVTPVESVDKAGRLIFVLGTGPLDPPPAFFRSFVRKGGVLVVASEERNVDTLLSLFALKLAPSIERNWRPKYCFLGQPDCPLIETFHPETAPGLFDEIRKLAANRARAVKGRGAVLAEFPPPFFLSDVFVARKPFGRIVEFGRGKVLALGDQSLFIDLMIGEEDNEKFLRNILEFAGADRVVVFLNGLPAADSLSAPKVPPVPSSSLPLPPMRSTLSDFNRLFSDIQKSIPARKLGKEALPVLLLGAAFVLFLLLMRKIVNTYIPGPDPAKGAARRGGGRIAAERLLLRAPPGARRRLEKLVRRAGTEKGFRRFLEEFSNAFQEHRHGS